MLDRILRWLSKPENRPSWMTSTLSEMAILSVIAYLGVAVYLSLKAKDIGPVKWAAEVFGVAYFARKMGNGNNPPSPPNNVPSH